MNILERRFQDQFIKRLRQVFPGCMILKNDPNYLQGVPDLLLLWRERWAAFELKTSKDADVQPNQKHYVLLLNAMSFSSFVYPENAEKVLHELQHAFQTQRPARVSQRQQISLDQLRRSQADGGLDQLSSSKTRNGTTRARTSSNTSRS